MKRAFIFRTVALLIVACMTLTFVLAGALPDGSSDHGEGTAVCEDGGMTNQEEPGEGEDNGEPGGDDTDNNNGDTGDNDGDTDINAGDTGDDSGDPDDENSDTGDNSDDTGAADDTSADTGSDDGAAGVTGTSLNLFSMSGGFVDFTQADDLLGDDLVLFSSDPPPLTWDDDAPDLTGHTGIVEINVLPTAKGTLIIPDAEPDDAILVTLYFDYTGPFNGDIDIGKNGGVFFEVPKEHSVTALGNITGITPTTIIYTLVKNGEGTLTLAGTVSFHSEVESIDVNMGKLLITGTTTIKHVGYEGGFSLRISSDSSVTINSDGNEINGIENKGSLSISGGNTTINRRFLSEDGDVTINGSTVTTGTINLTGGGGSFTINGGTTIVNGSISSNEGDVNISSGTVTIKDGITTSGGGNVTISNGTVTIDGDLLSDGDVTIKGGTVTIDGDLLSDNGKVTISGGNVTITGYIFSDGDVNISNGTVEISDGSIVAFGDVNISNGTVEISDGSIIAFGDVNIENNSTVTITATGPLSAIEAQSIRIKGSSGDFSSESDYAVFAESTTTLHVDPALTVWKAGDQATLAGISADNRYFVIAGTDTPLSAVAFATYTVNVSGGTIQGVGSSGTIKANELVRLTANTPPGYRFTGWTFMPLLTPPLTLISGDFSTPVIEFIMPFATLEITASFKPLHAITVSRTGTGTGVASANEEEAIQGTRIDLMATPGADSYFVRWEVIAGNVTLSNATYANATFVMPDEDVEVRAVFNLLPPEQHSITVIHTGYGVANANVNAAAQGAFITLTATPDSGNRFVRWEVVRGGITLSSTTTATATFVMPNVNVEVRAVFEPIPGTTTPTSPQMGDPGMYTGIMLAFMAMGTGGATLAGIKAVRSKYKK